VQSACTQQWEIVVRVLIGLAMTALAVVGCGAAAPFAPASPAPAPSGWAYRAWTDPDLEVAVPARWEIATDLSTEEPSVPPDAGPKQMAILTGLGPIMTAGGYRANISGRIPTPLGEGGPGYVEVYTEKGDWSSLDGYRDHWATIAAPLNHLDKGKVRFPAGEAAVIEVDDKFESEGNFLSRAVWYMFLLPDGRGMTITVGTYDDPESGAAGSPLADVRTFGDQVVATLRPSSRG
jgi:hypothetical protein